MAEPGILTNDSELSVMGELSLRGLRCWCCGLMRRDVMQQVIWAALFALAVLVREGSTPHSPALRAIAACGMLPILNACMSDYKVQLRTASTELSLPAEHKGRAGVDTRPQRRIVSCLHVTVPDEDTASGQPFSMQPKDCEYLGRSMMTACLDSWDQGVDPTGLLWQAKAASRTGSGDEMIISAGDFLVQALKPAARRMAWERGTLCLVAFAALGEPADSSRHLSCIVALLVCEHSLLLNKENLM